MTDAPNYQKAYARQRRQQLKADGLKQISAYVTAGTYERLKAAVVANPADDTNTLPRLAGAILSDWAANQPTPNASPYQLPDPAAVKLLCAALISDEFPGESLQTRLRNSQLVLEIADLSTEESGPTVSQIAAKWKIHASTAQRAVQPLVERGVLVREQRVAHAGAPRNSILSIHRDALDNLQLALRKARAETPPPSED